MKEIKSIIESYGKIDFTNRKAVLATVVKVTGSSYRSPGARMLITDDGKWIGSISGGCLEGDALRKARTVMSSGIAATFTYDTREESNQSLGVALGCNGVIDVLFEPLFTDKANSVTLLETLLSTNEPAGVATIYAGPSAIGAKLAIRDDGTILKQETPAELLEEVAQQLRSTFTKRTSRSLAMQTSAGAYEVFFEVITPGISLVIFGGGFDARPLSVLAKSLGWHVTVTDECVSHIAPVFFPGADQLSLCKRERVYQDVDVTPYSACILMSHNYEYDRDILASLLDKEPAYIGILGPRKRFDKMQEELRARGILIPEEKMRHIHSPVGLDIGAETPEEIAVSIVAEIQAVFAGRNGGFLRSKSGPIHHRTEHEQVVRHYHLKGAL